MKLFRLTANFFLGSIVLAALLFFGNFASAQTPSPALLVLNKDDNTLSIIDPASLKTITQVPTGEAPHEITVSTDGKFAFVANYGSSIPGNTLSMIDLVAQKELRRVDLGALHRPHGIVFVDGKVYFSAEENKAIGRYDPASNKVDVVVLTGQERTHMLVFSKDAQQLYTANIESNSVSALKRIPNDPAGGSVEAIPVGKKPEGLDISPDGRELWAANSGDGTVSILDLASRKVTQTLDVHTKRSNRLKFTPDGKLVLISDLAAGDLLILSAASREELKRINLGRQPEGILIAPDGARAYIAVNGDKTVAILDLKSLEVVARISTGNGPDGLAWAVRP